VDFELEFWRDFWKSALTIKREEVTTNGQNIIKRVSEYLARYYEADQIKETGSTSSIHGRNELISINFGWNN
jgi:hypothetical protein